MPDQPPRVFISYSHDSDEHRTRVRELAGRLRKDGLDARLDQFEPGRPRDGWPTWCARQIELAEYVLVVCTQRYRDRFIGRGGIAGGVPWEGRLINNKLYGGPTTIRFLPLLFSQADRPHIPSVFDPVETHVLENSNGEAYGELLVELGHRMDRTPLDVPVHRELTVDEQDLDVSVFDPAVQHDIAKRLQAIEDTHRPPLVFRPRYDPDGDDTEESRVGIADLRHSRRWLGYRPRPREEEQLREFMEHPAPFRWWGVVGEGGVGKSRLVLEFALRLQSDGWEVGFLSGTNVPNWLSDTCRGWRPSRPTLLLVDYATHWSAVLPEGLKNLTEALGSDSDQPKVRLLIVDRPGRFGPAFVDLAPDQHHDDQLRRAAREGLHAVAGTRRQEDGLRAEAKMQRSHEPLVEDDELLQVSGLGREEWRDVLVEVVQRTGGDAERIPDTTETDWWSSVQRLTGDGRLLYLQLLGLCLACNSRFVTGLMDGRGRADLLDAMLNRELDERWPGLFPQGINRQSPAFDHAVRATAFITLCRGLTLPDNVNALKGALGDVSTEDLTVLDDVLPRLLRADAAEDDPDGRDLPPLEPDLLGERLLLHVSSPRPLGLGLAPTPQLASPGDWLPLAAGTDESGTLETLRLLVQDFPDEPVSLLWAETLFDWIEGQPPEDRSDDVLNGLATVAGEIYRRSENLPDWLTNRCVELARSDGRTWMAFWSQLGGGLESDPGTVPVLLRQHDVLQLLAEIGKSFGSWFFDWAISVGAGSLIAHFDNAGRFDELEAWGAILREQGGRFPVDAAIQLALAQGAVNAIAAYGRAGRLAELEAWGAILHEQAARLPDEAKIQLQLAQGAVNAMRAYGNAGRFDELEARGALLREQAARFPDEAGIQLALARGAVNALTAFGEAGRFDELEAWGTLLREQAGRFPDDAEIQRTLAEGAVNAIVHYGNAGRFDELEAWGALLREQGGRFPGEAAIQLRLAQGTFNAIISYGEAGRFDELEAWGAILQEQAGRFPDEAAIQLELANGAVNAIGRYGKARRFDELEAWGAILQEQAGRFPDEAEIQRTLAEGAVNAIACYGEAGRLAELEAWGEHLREQSDRFPDEAEIQLRLAQGAFNAINSYGEAGRFDELEIWGAILREQGGRFPDEARIQLPLAKGAVNATAAYVKAGRFDELEAWGEILREQAARFPGEAEIQLGLAMGAFNAIVVYGNAGRFDELEAWGALLREQADRFPDEAEIQLRLARGAFNASLYYGKAGRFDELEAWGAIL
ncbi:toll/interleukin-1 receptor domain-containing protein, partial [Maioricimonas sp. JC845]|uniref:toll/interleukin-1 receptor domain-containing protein n=1 Tax=Maioricimonas sp. JC845 TaxID=3232138 RepID=UPI0034581423